MTIEQAKEVIAKIGLGKDSEEEIAIRIAYRALCTIQDINKLPYRAGAVDRALQQHGFREAK